MLVPEQLLNLAQVGARAEQLGGEHVAQRVGGDALALVHARRRGVATERHGHDARRQAFAVDAQEQRGVVRIGPHGGVGDEQRHEAGVDRHNALSAALGVAHADQAPVEVHVLAVQAKQLGAAQPAVGEQGEQQAVALALAGVQARPDALAARHIQQARELCAVEHVGQRLALLGRAQDVGGVALQVVALDAEAKEAAQRGDRACLA